MNPDLSITAGAAREWVPFLRKHLLAAHRLLDKEQAPAELAVALVGDKVMSQLHEEFMNLPGPTDVLTFEMDRDPAGRVSAGQIVICIPEARRAARRLGTDPKHEMLLYAIHGLLHLCGFDDRTQSDYERMHQKEDDLLARIGIGPVFAAGRVARRRKHS